MQELIRPVIVASLLCFSPAVFAADFTTYSGEQLFQRLCASCHGKEARGDGPVSASLAVTVPNLRELQKRNRGEFPIEKIEKIIDGRIKLAPHGTRAMPVWGDELLRSEAGDPEAERSAADLIHKIAEYLRGIQEPAATPEMPLK
jgi:mono/diheme cytochrome c family protein